MLVMQSNVKLPSIHNLLSSINEDVAVTPNGGAGISSSHYANNFNTSSTLLPTPLPSSFQITPRTNLPPLLLPLTPPSSNTSTRHTSVSGASYSSLTATPVSNLTSSTTPTSTKTKKNSKATLPKKCRCRNYTEGGDHIPRPRNAFILFRQHLHNSIFGKDQNMLLHHGSFKTNSLVSREIGKRWRLLPAEEKKYWQDLALKEKELHKKKYPHYKYIPRKMETLENIRQKKRKDITTGGDTSDHLGKDLCGYCKLNKKGLLTGLNGTTASNTNTNTNTTTTTNTPETASSNLLKLEMA